MNIKTMFKYEEIKQHFLDYVKDNYTNLKEALEDEDLHDKVFNQDYYIIGYHQAEQWLIQERSCCGNTLQATLNYTFECLNYVIEKNEIEFGYTHKNNINDAETLVNNYAYWLGQEIIEEIKIQSKREKIKTVFS